MGHSKYDKTTEKSNYRNGTTKKNLKDLNLETKNTNSLSKRNRLPKKKFL